jgi:hypothetical protein
MNAPPALNWRGQPILHLGTFRGSSSAAPAKAFLKFHPLDEEFPMSPTGKSVSPEE